MQTTSEFISSERRVELEKELKELQTVQRKSVIEKLEFAKSLGDLSENAEYHSAREEQARLEERIAKIEYVLKTSKVMERHSSSTVEIGSTIVIKKEGSSDPLKVSVVGTEETDMLKGFISHRSPLGAALLGKNKGDTVKVNTPKGAIGYTIISIE